MNNERLSPRELAEQLKTTAGYEIVNGRVESEQLARLIDRSQAVWHELKDGRFEEDEDGYATIEVQDWTSDYQTDSGDHVDALRVHFHDPEGGFVPLGCVSRIGFTNRLATAEVAKTERQSDPLLPGDKRWDAVVGVVERAIAECEQTKKK
jgi:hypothetical protein